MLRYPLCEHPYWIRRGKNAVRPSASSEKRASCKKRTLRREVLRGSLYQKNIYLYMYTRTYVAYIHIYMCIYVYIFTYIYIYTHLYSTRASPPLYHPPIFVDVHIHLSIYIYICVCVCVYIYIHKYRGERERERARARHRERERSLHLGSSHIGLQRGHGVPSDICGNALKDEAKDLGLTSLGLRV